MAHFHIKKKRGRPYLYVREIARVNGKPTVVSQVYIGSPDKVRKLAQGEAGDIVELKAEEFGALLLAVKIDEDIDLAGIIDGVVTRGSREKGPTVGEHFLYSALNRMVEAKSKNSLSMWYKRTAIQQIRPVDITRLTSQRYWDKWDRVSESDLKRIATRFFQRIWEVESPDADCLLFDTTNYYTYMASQTESDLARRGKNKDKKDHLRQVGLALLVTREERLPIYYSVYPGNLHDSNLFGKIMDEMFGVVLGLGRTKQRMTVVIDKGMNSEDNYAWVDEHRNIHFVTTYSTYFAEELTQIPLSSFEPADTDKNRRMAREGAGGERILAYRTRGTYWGKERAVVITYNPATARKQEYNLEGKLETLRDELLLMRRKVREGLPHWRDPDRIKERYHRLCQRLYMPGDLYQLSFEATDEDLAMSFRKNPYLVNKRKSNFGKSIIVTDNTDWTTSQIIEAHLARSNIENRFRLSKEEDLVGVQPFRHWTDSKIRCHLFTCVVAMTYLCRLERRLDQAGIRMSPQAVMDEMRHLHSILLLTEGSRKPRRRLETPTKTQSEVLKAFGYYIDGSGVLQVLPQ